MEEKENKTKSAVKKINKKTLWIIGGAVVVIAMIVILVLVNRAKKNSAATYQTEAISKGELVAIVGATGTVRANQTAYLTWQTSGRIEKVNYQVGGSVAAGETLANLAMSSLPQSVILAASDLVTAQQNLHDLKSSTLSLSNAELNLANAQRAYNTALSNYWNRNQTQGSQDLITVTQTKLQILDNKIVDLKKLYDNMAELKDTDTAKAQALQNLTQARIDREKLKQLLDYYKANLSALDTDIVKGKLDVAKANLDQAQKDYDQVKTGTNPDDIAAAQAKVTALQATVDMGSLTAPFAGTVTESDSLVGDLVNPGTTSFRVDDLSLLLVDVQIPEVDINSIKVGQDATLTFDAVSNAVYTAKVTDVARVGENVAGVVNFKVTLEIQNPDAKVLPGMTAAVNITVTKLENVLTVPNRSVRTVNSETVIFVLRNGIVVQVPIVLGSASDTRSEIASGDIKDGDQVILNPPSSLMDLMQSQRSSGSMRP
jgi:HlyD family secretion protein